MNVIRSSNHDYWTNFMTFHKKKKKTSIEWEWLDKGVDLEGNPCWSEINNFFTGLTIKCQIAAVHYSSLQ